MPVARIVTHVDPESPALKEISEQLRAAGYEVEVAGPGNVCAAEMVIEADQLTVDEALDAALRIARESRADLYVAPGLFAVETTPRNVEAPEDDHARRLAEQPAPPEIHIDPERGGVVGSTLEEVGAALAEGRAGIRDTISGLSARAAQTWGGWQQRRVEAAQQRRMERERREIEREQRRRDHELELARQIAERQRLQAERERIAAEQERLLREQVAHEAAVRAEHDRAEREALAREAARRAELAYAEEAERRRAAAMEAERQRALQEQEASPAAFAGTSSQPRVSQGERGLQPVPAPQFNVRRARPRPRIPSRRERQWQRAAFLASLATLAAMLGFAIAANMSPSAPLSKSLMENRAQQEVPFGPAKIAPTKSNPQPAVTRAAPARSAAKPEPAKPVTPHRARRMSRERNVIAEDEVTVRHFPDASAQRVQTRRGPTTAGVRHYSDDN